MSEKGHVEAADVLMQCLVFGKRVFGCSDRSKEHYSTEARKEFDRFVAAKRKVVERARKKMARGLAPPFLQLHHLRAALTRAPHQGPDLPRGLAHHLIVQVRVALRRALVSTLLIEESPISLGLIQSLRERSINVTTYKPDTDKLARLIAQSDLFAGGSVRLPKHAPWLEEFVAELLAFPGRHDDQVDALTQGLAWGRQRWSRKMRIYAVPGLY